MGLQERRAVKDFQDNYYAGIKQDLDSAAGFDVNMDVKWDELQVEDYSHLYIDGFQKVYFLPLIEAFKAICIDDLGKDALKAGLKQVVIRNSGTTNIAFENGVITIDHHPVANIDYWEDRKNDLQTKLEKAL